MTLTKPSRDSPLGFSLLGGQEKGSRIFIDAVEPGSKAAEVGLKRGDQVRVLTRFNSEIFGVSCPDNSSSVLSLVVEIFNLFIV